MNIKSLIIIFSIMFLSLSCVHAADENVISGDGFGVIAR